MIEFGERSPYQTFAAVSPHLLKRGADAHTVSLMGVAVSDALDHGCPDGDVQLIIADLEAARSNAVVGEINREWELPLSGLLGVLRQTVHNRDVLASTLNPSSTTLRDKVLAAIDAGINTPTDIGARLKSPTTVISRVLRQLADEGRVEPGEPVEDRRQRPYRRVKMTAEGTGEFA